jgi:hypothetical protein
MGKVFEQKINNFSGGFSNDKRATNFSKYGITRHFDTYSFPHKLVPFYGTSPLAGEDKTKRIIKFVYAPTSNGGTTYRLWGFGGADVGALTNNIEVYYLSGGSWSQVGGVFEGGTSNRNTSVFFYYKGYIYMWVNNAALSRCDVAGSIAFENAYKSITITSGVAEPVHHPSDDIAYFFVNNTVYKQSVAGAIGGADLTLALTLPPDLKITCACPYGDYLAIGCAPVDAAALGQKSVVYLWDRDSSVTTVTQRIDFGEGNLTHLASLDGKLIGVLNFFATKCVIKQANGNSSVIINEIPSDSYSGLVMPATRAVKNNKLYFPLTAPQGSDAQRGIWSVDSSGRATIAIVENEVESASSKTYESVYSLGDDWLICHSGDFSTNLMGFYTGISGSGVAYYLVDVSQYETLIINGGDSSQKKKLVSVTAEFEALPVAGSVTVKYKKDAETSYTTIFTDSTDNDISHKAINIESSGDTLPQFYEIQLRVGSIGGAVITGLKVKWEEIDDSIEN